MAIRMTQETEQLVREEIRNGYFTSVDDLIVQGLRAWHDRSARQAVSGASAEQRLRAVERIRELRACSRLERSGMTLRDVAHLGHRY